MSIIGRMCKEMRHSQYQRMNTIINMAQLQQHAIHTHTYICIYMDVFKSFSQLCMLSGHHTIELHLKLFLPGMLLARHHQRVKECLSRLFCLLFFASRLPCPRPHKWDASDLKCFVFQMTACTSAPHCTHCIRTCLHELFYFLIF